MRNFFIALFVRSPYRLFFGGQPFLKGKPKRRSSYHGENPLLPLAYLSLFGLEVKDKLN